MIRFACPGCSATFTAAANKAGKVSKCPKCGAAFAIPEAYSPPPPPPVAVPPPPPPRPAGNDPIEIQPCPKCQSRLSVLAADLGAEIECPSCHATYTAVRTDAPLPPRTPASAPVSSSLVPAGSGSVRTRDDDDDVERPRKKKRRRYDEEDEDDYEEPPLPKRRKRSGGSTRGSVTVRRLGVLSVGKMMGGMYAVIGLIYSLIYGVLFLIGAGLASQAGGNVGKAAAGTLLGYGICAIVLMPIIMGVSGFIGGVILAALYNLLAGMMGGIEMDLE